MKRFFGRQKGSILIMAMFFVVALMTVIPGTMLQMMRVNREAQHYVDRAPLTFAADAVAERAVQIISDYTLSNATFPTSTTVGSFSASLGSWYAGFKSRAGNYGAALANITLNGIAIEDMGLEESDSSKRRYKVTVKATQGITKYALEVEQEVVIHNARLFDFSVFYDDDLEITAGSDFTLQGPLFSNKNIYLMNHRGSTLNLIRSSDFDEDGREKYVMNSAGNIYFYFKRALAYNYLLDNSTYFNSVPAYYQTAPAGLELFAHPIKGSVNPKLSKPPFAYYFQNSVKLGYQIDGCGSGDCPSSTQKNVIRAENEAGTLINLIAQRPTIQWNYYWHSSTGTNQHDPKYYLHYSPASPYSGAAGFMSVSTAFNPSNLADSLPVVNPAWASNSLYTSGMVKSNVSQKSIPLGDPNHPHGPHAIIEPLTSIFPQGHPGSAFTPSEICPAFMTSGGKCVDTPEVKEAKFQRKANLNLYVDFATGQFSADLKKLYVKDREIVPGVEMTESCSGCCDDGGGNVTQSWKVKSRLYDYRLRVDATTLNIDIGKLVQHLNALGLNNSSGVLIYVHTYPLEGNSYDQYSKPHFVKLLNAKKIPEYGLTVVSNGRVFIQGDFNTFDYGKNDNCTTGEWNSKTCHVPPAAIVSDSVAILSNQWSDSYDSATPASDREVTGDVTVNTAFATGYLPSELTRRYYCNEDMSNCMARRDINSNQSLGIPTASGVLAAYSADWGCSSGDWRLGKDLPPLTTCQYYEDLPSGSGLFYLNPKSSHYQNAINNYPPPAGGSLPVCNPLASGGPTDCDNIRIPIYADPNASGFGTSNSIAIRPFYGVAFKTLHPRSICFSGVCSATTSGGQYCADGSTPTRTCEQYAVSGEGDPYCVDYTPYVCANGSAPLPGASSTGAFQHSISYDSSQGYEPLYTTHYSGGLENLTNLQESWNYYTNPANLNSRVWYKLNLSGTLSSPWLAKELKVGGVKKYYEETYFSSPIRTFYYNDDLRNDPPPEVPFVFSVERKKWQVKGK